MPLGLTLLIYNLLLVPFLVLSFPGWLLTMTKRGGFGTGLLQRLGMYERDVEFEPTSVIYIHAVSVGEVMLAQKLIQKWRQLHPEQKFVLAATTATGHAVAIKSEDDVVRVIYSPVDLPWITWAVLKRFSPRAIVLIESELWPNMLSIAQKMDIPVAVANARLSPRSQKRYLKLKPIIGCVFGLLEKVCVPEKEDVARWEEIGARSGTVVATGGLKYDQEGAETPQKRERFQQMIDAFGQGRPVILCASTFSGEEELLAHAIQEADERYLPVLVPRHAERRDEVVTALKGAGFDPTLRSQFSGKGDCLVIDSTGELKDWTAHADVVIIGKSWLEKGGQSPVEAISAGIPVITGPDMSNFSALIFTLNSAGGIRCLSDVSEVPDALKSLVSGGAREAQIKAAQSVLEGHSGATKRMVLEIFSILS